MRNYPHLSLGHVRGYIQQLGVFPFTVLLYTQKQINIFKKVLAWNSDIVFYLDASGNQIKEWIKDFARRQTSLFCVVICCVIYICSTFVHSRIIIILFRRKGLQCTSSWIGSDKAILLRIGNQVTFGGCTAYSCGRIRHEFAQCCYNIYPTTLFS